MSRVMRRKHVLKEMMDDDYDLPKEHQQIVRVVNCRGNNLHEVESATEAENFLVSMPNKFRKNVWVKRGDFLLVEPIEEGDKVKAEIHRILTPEHIKEYTKAGIWPKRFTKKRAHEDDDDGLEHDGSTDEQDADFMVRNHNRPVVSANYVDEDDSETSSEEDDDED